MRPDSATGAIGVWRRESELPCDRTFRRSQEAILSRRGQQGALQRGSPEGGHTTCAGHSGDRHGALRSTVTLLREGTQELYIEASMGLSAAGTRVHYLIGEGVTGRVVETGKPVVVPQVSREPMFLNRAGQRKYSPSWEITFICVPILINHKPVGSLSVDLLFDTDQDYSRETKFFGVVSSMIAQAVKINRLIDAERRRFLEENVHLREELRERYDFSNLIGNSGPIRRVYEQVTQVASTNTTVMLRGESEPAKN